MSKTESKNQTPSHNSYNEEDFDDYQLLKSGILEEYHDKYFNDFYGAPERRDEMKKAIKKFEQQTGRKVNLDIEKGKEIYQKVIKYADNIENAYESGINLLLVGPNGTGKTLLGVSVLKKAMIEGYTAQFATLSGIIDVYSAGWYDDEKKDQFHHKVRKVDFLMIDDIGKEYNPSSADLVRTVFDRVLRYRSMRKLPTIFTTNLELSKINTEFGNSLQSLLTGDTYKISVEGADYRKIVKSKTVENRLVEK